FWEGVDVPGRALRVLILAKLPFKVPSEPLTAARLERLEARGLNGFTHYLVPHGARAARGPGAQRFHALPRAPRGAQAETGVRAADSPHHRRRGRGAARPAGRDQALRPADSRGTAARGAGRGFLAGRAARVCRVLRGVPARGGRGRERAGCVR